MKCGVFYDVNFIANSTGVPRCPKCGGIVKPDVVLYEEGLDEEVLSGAVSAIRKADTLIIGGTSLVVYPAAGLIRYFRGRHLWSSTCSPPGPMRRPTCALPTHRSGAERGRIVGGLR